MLSRAAHMSITLATIFLIVAGAGSPVAAKEENQIELGRRYYFPGEVAVGRLRLVVPRERKVLEAHTALYLVPDREDLGRYGLLPARGPWRDRVRPSLTPVEPAALRIERGWLILRFVVPDVTAGTHRILLCDSSVSCDWRESTEDGLPPAYRGWISVVDERQHLPLWWSVDQAHREVLKLRKKVAFLEHRLQRLRRWKEEYGPALRELPGRVAVMETKIAELEEQASTISRTPVTPLGFGWIALLGLAGATIVLATKTRKKRRRDEDVDHELRVSGGRSRGC